jgi:hypothetical protein
LRRTPGPKTRVTQTERIEFPAGGVLVLNHSIGELDVIGWDQPTMEMKITKSLPLRYDSHWHQKAEDQSKLDEVHVTAQCQGNEIVIVTDSCIAEIRDRRLSKVPLASISTIRSKFPAIPAGGYQGGEVHVEDITGDIYATTVRGEISLRLAEQGEYDIDAKSGFGGVGVRVPRTPASQTVAVRPSLCTGYALNRTRAIFENRLRRHHYSEDSKAAGTRPGRSPAA